MRASIVSRPSAGKVLLLARRERAALEAGGHADLRAHLEAKGNIVIVKPLRARFGGLEACVAPMATGLHRFVCDPDGCPGEPTEIAQLPDPAAFRVAFRLAHEYAHTLRAPAGRLQAHHTVNDVEEGRCDLFALALLVGTHGHPTSNSAAPAYLRAELARIIGDGLAA